MPFAEDVRAELAEVLPVQPHCRLAQLAGVVRHAGAFHLLAGSAVEVHIDLASSLAARRTVELLRTRGAVCEIRTYREHRFERSTRFLIVVGDDARSLQALHEAGILSAGLAPIERVPARIVSRSCCRRSYLRGAFIGCGSLSRPRSPAHLEWRVTSDAAAFELRELAEAEGFALGVHETPRYWLVYAKSRETIRGLLAALGAHGAELRLEEQGVFAWAREEANRLANADAGNLRRQAAASARHTDAIEQLGGPGTLPPELRAVAELRLRLPDATLAELGEAATPPLSKWAVASRLRRIVQRAEL
ncbi:MAG: cell division protein WhiA [Gaiellales bacterium]|nr:cell division protein WhiA [Gaiellales bacterium]MDX6596820.1 cell division protein WhiA [Gaiellales bacterium]